MAKDMITCPSCGEVGDYKTGQNKKSPGQTIRKKQCNKCGQWIETIEVLVGPIKVKSRNKADSQPAGVQPAGIQPEPQLQLQPETQPQIPPQTEIAAQPQTQLESQPQ